MRTEEWKRYLLRQAVKHPSMGPQDVYKMMFQAAFGAEHLLQDKEAALAYFQKEFEEVLPEEEPLYEQIQEDVCRVNLGSWKKRNIPAEWLFRMFVGSVGMRYDVSDEKTGDEKIEQFLQYAEIAKESVKEGHFSFSHEEFLQYAQEYNKTGPRPVHHSERYREAEKPAYRLVNSAYVRLLPILEVMVNKEVIVTEADKPTKNGGIGKPVIIAIDGRCASGKSTMARMLSEITGAGVVHMDDFFLPIEFRTQERLVQPGGNVHYERFQAEVLPHLKAGGAFSYRRFDCSRMQLGEERKVADSNFYIVEGAYSQHPAFGEYADLKVFSDVASETQLKRIGKRDGEASLVMFKERWIPMEENYIKACYIRHNADIIL